MMVGDKKKTIVSMKKSLKKFFTMKDGGPNNQILGLNM